MKTLGMLFFVFSLNAIADVPFYQNAQKSMAYQVSGSWLNLGRYIQGALINGKTGLSPDELKILQQISDIYPDEVKNTKVEVLVGKDHPEIFNIGGAPRIAVTGNSLHSTINLNQDLLVNSQTGEIITRARSISFLTHELGHHLGIDDTQERILDKIGDAVAQYFTSQSESADLSMNKLPLVGGYVFNISDFESLKKMNDRSLRFPEIKINTGDYVKVFNNVIIADIQKHFPACSNTNNIQLVYATNLRWSELPNPLNDGAEATMMANLRILCGSSLSSASEYKGYFFYRGLLKTSNSQFIFDSDRGIAAVLESATFDNPLEATVDGIKFNTAIIRDGGPWTGMMQIRLSTETEIKDCAVTFSADDFPQSNVGERLGVKLKKCTLTKKSSTLYELNVADQFTATTRTGKFYIKDIILIPRDQKIQPLYVSTPTRQTVEVVNSRFSPLKAIQVRLLDKKMSDSSQTGISQFAQTDVFNLEIKFAGNLVHVQDFYFTFNAQSTSGQIVSTFQELQDQQATKMNVRKEGAFTILTIQDAFSLSLKGIKLINLYRLQILDDNLQVIEVGFPTTFQIRLKG
jgi:hypothetical protein